MNSVERQTVQDCTDYLVDHLEPVVDNLIDQLYSKGGITSEQLGILRRLTDRSGKVRVLLQTLPDTTTFKTFSDSLDICECNFATDALKDHISELENSSASQSTGYQSASPEPDNQHLSTEDHVSKTWHELTSMLYNGEIEKYFEQRKNYLKATEDYARAILFVIEDCLLTYCFIKYPSDSQSGAQLIRIIMKKLKECKERDPGNNLIEGFYLIRHAVELAKENKFAESQKCLSDGFSHIETLNCNRSSQFASVLQIYVLHLEWESAVQNPSNGDLTSVMNRMDQAFKAVVSITKAIPDIAKDYTYFHIRVVSLSCAFVHLGMNVNAEVIYRDANDVERAEGFLYRVDEYWHGIKQNLRVEMFYYIARIEYWMCQNNFAKAREYVTSAVELLKLCQEGEFQTQSKILTAYEVELAELMRTQLQNNDGEDVIDGILGVDNIDGGDSIPGPINLDGYWKKNICKCGAAAL